MVFIEAEVVAQLVEERDADFVAVGFEMAIAIVPEVVEEETDAWQFIRRSGRRIAAGVSLEKAEKIGIEVCLDFEKGFHLRELDGAGGGLISNDGWKRRERAFDDAGGDGLQTLETHGG